MCICKRVVAGVVAVDMCKCTGGELGFNLVSFIEKNIPTLKIKIGQEKKR